MASLIPSRKGTITSFSTIISYSGSLSPDKISDPKGSVIPIKVAIPEGATTNVANIEEFARNARREIIVF
ncbi:MAG: hypothetical protein RBT56_14815 [Ignavibacteriaceae bacterium]|nr:hypothetical protein [Ignavibacteriaceae bacterium]